MIRRRAMARSRHRADIGTRIGLVLAGMVAGWLLGIAQAATWTTPLR